MRTLILFDIDGTLVWGGPAKTAFCQAMEETYGTVGDLQGVSFGGKTDPEIARALLTSVGFDDRDVEQGLDELWTRYLGYLGELITDDPPDVLPGVHELLDALAVLDDIGMGLLTGNIYDGARLKLGAAGLWGRFGFGSYGSDNEVRDELPRIAMDRAREAYATVPGADRAIVVGDTPRDVQCGKAGGMRTLAVATGMYSLDELSVTGADHVVSDFTDTGHVVSLLTG